MLVEHAAGKHGYLEDLEKMAADRAVLRLERLRDAGPDQWATLDHGWPTVPIASRRQAGRAAGLRDAWNRLDPPDELFLKDCASPGVVAHGRQADVERQNPIDADAKIDLLQSMKACEEHARASQKRQGQRDLRDHEAVSNPALTARTGGRSRLLAERTIRIEASETQCRRDAERDRRRDGQGRRESEHDRVNADLVEPWQCVTTELPQHVHGKPGEPESQQSAESSQEQALDQELADESATARAQSGADRELLNTAGRAHEHEVGDVHARDEEHEPDRNREHLEDAS